MKVEQLVWLGFWVITLLGGGVACAGQGAAAGEAMTGDGGGKVPAFSHPAQEQIRTILPILQDSEAEHVMGAYVPGVGAVLTADMVRGPNALVDKLSAQGVLDWAVYIMQTYGARLDAVPPEEVVSISIEFFDYDQATMHQLVLVVPALRANDPAAYTVWLNGRPYAEVMAAALPPEPTRLVLTLTPPPAPTATATLEPLMGWEVLSGEWVAGEALYRQEALGLYDLISFLKEPVGGDYRWQAEVQFVAGEMGAGLVWNAPDFTSKGEANMVSFTADGSYMQWGVYDNAGIFQFQGGQQLDKALTDDQWHLLAVEQRGDTATLFLDDLELGSLTVIRQDPAYVGLLANTSALNFRNIVVKELAP